jgi:hypothetical protein
VLCTAALAVGVVGSYEAPDRSPQILLTNARATKAVAVVTTTVAATGTAAMPEATPADKCDALIHAAQCDCEPAIPLVQPETISALKPPAVLVVVAPPVAAPHSPSRLRCHRHAVGQFRQR